MVYLAQLLLSRHVRVQKALHDECVYMYMYSCMYMYKECRMYCTCTCTGAYVHIHEHMYCTCTDTAAQGAVYIATVLHLTAYLLPESRHLVRYALTKHEICPPVRMNHTCTMHMVSPPPIPPPSLSPLLPSLLLSPLIPPPPSLSPLLSPSLLPSPPSLPHMLMGGGGS